MSASVECIDWGVDAHPMLLIVWLSVTIWKVLRLPCYPAWLGGRCTGLLCALPNREAVFEAAPQLTPAATKVPPLQPQVVPFTTERGFQRFAAVSSSEPIKDLR